MNTIRHSIDLIIKQFSIGVTDYVIEHPKDDKFGDYSTNVALVIAKNVGQKPRDLAEKIATELQNDIEINRLISKVEVAGAGFINLYLKEEKLVSTIAQVQKAVSRFGNSDNWAGQKVMVEFTDPNPFKEFHIGHLMSNTIGEAIARLVESQGAEVKRANYQGDVGLHVAKSIWGLQQMMGEKGLTLEKLQGMTLQERQKILGQAYALGAGEYETDEAAKAEMQVLNKKIYQKSDDEIIALYQAGRVWSLEYFETIYARLGTKFDEYFFESETGVTGLEVVEEAIAKGILETGDEGAIVYKGEKDGMHTRVFRNKLGLPTYEAKDLGLAKAKFGRYQYDKSIIITANEITEYFKVVLKVMEQLYPELRAKTVHLPHGIMKLTTGKMSSRTGKVVTGEGLLNELRDVVMQKMEGREIAAKETVADKIAVGALKYTVLRQQIGGDIVYDPEKITNMEGDTGPYLQYAYARTRSVMGKAMNSDNQQTQRGGESEGRNNPELLSVLRWLYRYPEIVEKAAKEYAPHAVAGYLYELASRYNGYYNKHKIIGGENESTALQMTEAVGIVIKNGLNLLGIAAPESM